MPFIDESGSARVEGGINIHCNPEGINFTERGLEIVGSKYTINNLLSSTTSVVKEGFAMDGGV